MYLNAARGLGAAPQFVGGRRVIALPRVVRPGGRNPHGLYLVARGMRGLGDCQQMPGVSYSNISGAVCRDNTTGSIVACSSPACSAPAPGSVASPSFTPTPTIQSIPVGGFTGTLPVPTLASALGDMLASKESPFNANLIAKGAVNPSTDAQDFLALALEHCTEYAASQGCDNPQAVAAQFVAQYQAWLKSQSAGAYQAADSGSLAGPVQVSVKNSPVPVAATVTLVNVSRPGQSLQVGDSWRLDITGPPNAPVSITATKNGASMGTTPMGSTDQSGKLSLNATADSSVVGDWREMVTVGASPAPVLAFSVGAASSGGAGAGNGAGTPGTGSPQAPPATPPATPPVAGGSLTDLLNKTFSIAGYNVPVWEAGLVVLGGAWLLGGKH